MIITDCDEAKILYVQAYQEVLRAEISYNISQLYLDQISAEIIKSLGKNCLDEIKEEIKRWEDDD